MSAELVGQTIANAGALLIAIALPLALVLSFWLPYMAWSATRNIRQIRQQLERLNDTLDSRAPSSPTNRFGV